MQTWLNKRASLAPQQIGLYYQGQSYTFQQIKQSVQHRAQQLVTLGVSTHEHVGIYGQNTFENYLNILALLQLNATIVFCNIRLASTELTQQLTDAKVKMCLVDQNTCPTNLADIHNLQVITLASLQQLQPTAFDDVDIQFRDVASLMYTSGTTGQPKGVLQTYGNHWASAMNTLLNFQVTQQDCWLCVVPLFHISGFSIVLRSLIYGIPLYLVEHFDAQICHRLLVDQPITIMSVVPTMLQELLAHNVSHQPYNDAFRLMFLGGAPLNSTLLTQCQQQHILVVQSYGMTETCSNVVALNNADAQRKQGSCGQALFTNQIRIADTGEIQLKSPALTPGYWHQAERWQAKLTTDDWFQTGDVGYLDDENFLFIKGRLDDMFVSGGENIFPNEIENVYQQIPQIQEIGVTSKPDLKWGAVPVAYLVGNDVPTADELIAFGRKNLAHYKVPVAFHQVDQLPHNSSGKLLRRKLINLVF
ncbi:o-succinylbenzoate--CoA ligase [Bombilactobacillus folatiphilus]|uniref:2-succinylbenzoate--CoA ligase n=1 Tax=Bombilactobacillus folatiphilus TaxID=2923362 RepID=A0ABY4P8F9_9LACO|nr:o-succinylbenzoate--CoA ligase [Bombilactobacillus folatiphilus]UQS81979.1 o-succinylbenzoate--CoA ligase [Bombilactobacillus folatiphilus]